LLLLPALLLPLLPPPAAALLLPTALLTFEPPKSHDATQVRGQALVEQVRQRCGTRRAGHNDDRCCRCCCCCRCCRDAGWLIILPLP
jgi:hypothetical protein